MPLIIRNECCDCTTESYPCLGDSCRFRHVPHLLCDDCGEEEKLFYYEDEMLCMDCIEKRLHPVDIREVDMDEHY